MFVPGIWSLEVLLLNSLSWKIDWSYSIGILLTLSERQNKESYSKKLKPGTNPKLFGLSLSDFTQELQVFLFAVLFVTLCFGLLSIIFLYYRKLISRGLGLQAFCPHLWTTVKVNYCRLLISFFVLCLFSRMYLGWNLNMQGSSRIVELVSVAKIRVHNLNKTVFCELCLIFGRCNSYADLTHFFHYF